MYSIQCNVRHSERAREESIGDPPNGARRWTLHGVPFRVTVRLRSSLLEKVVPNPPFNRGSGRRKAFSLVEVLVVIGIIALLMAILMPAMNRARETAKTLQCASNLRSIGMAIQSYANFNRGLLPAYSKTHNWPDDLTTPGLGVNDPDGPGWIILLKPFLAKDPDSPMFRCSNAVFDEPTVTYFMEARWMAMQQPELHTMPITKIKFASQYLLISEATTAKYYPAPFGTSSGGPDDIDKDDATWKCLVFFSDPREHGINMHAAGNNILFADNHVAALKGYEPQTLTYNPHALQDYDDIQQELPQQ